MTQLAHGGFRTCVHVKPVLLVAYHLGQRLGEIVNLTRDRVDLHRGFITLRGVDTKTKNPRRIPMTPGVREALADLAKVRSLKTNRVFLYKGEPVKQITRTFRTAKKAAGIKDCWVFRSAFLPNRQPKTSLERCCDRLEIKPTRRRVIEERMIREFRQAYHQFALHVPNRRSILEWLSIMQHHGAPTRLLDFTYSAYVAAYLAVEQAERDCVVWAIDGPWALQRSQELLRSAGKNTKRMLKPFMDEDEQAAQSLLMVRPYVPAAWPVNPFRLNERLRVQQGAFLVQSDISKSFRENLMALSGGRKSEYLIRIVIPPKMRFDVKEPVDNGHFEGRFVSRPGWIRAVPRDISFTL